MKNMLKIMAVMLLCLTICACSNTKSTSLEVQEGKEENNLITIDFLDGTNEPYISFSGRSGSGVAKLTLEIKDGETIYDDGVVQAVYNQPEMYEDSAWATIIKDGKEQFKITYNISEAKGLSNDQNISLYLGELGQLKEIGYKAKEETFPCVVADLIEEIKSVDEIVDIEEIKQCAYDYVSQTSQDVEIHDLYLATTKDGTKDEYKHSIIFKYSYYNDMQKCRNYWIERFCGAYYEDGQFKYDKIDFLSKLDCEGEPTLEEYLKGTSDQYIYEEIK